MKQLQSLASAFRVKNLQRDDEPRFCSFQRMPKEVEVVFLLNLYFRCLKSWKSVEFPSIPSIHSERLSLFKCVQFRAIGRFVASSFLSGSLSWRIPLSTKVYSAKSQVAKISNSFSVFFVWAVSSSTNDFSC